MSAFTPAAAQPGDARWERLRGELVAERDTAPSSYSRSSLDWVLRLMDRIDREAGEQASKRDVHDVLRSRFHRGEL